MRKQFPRIDAALRPSPSRTPLLALIATKQPSSRGGSTSIVPASEKRESTFDSIRRNVEQVMLNQASAKASTDMLRQEQRLRAAEKAASDAQVVVEELQKENATLRGLLDLEKETFKRIEFDVVSAQALCSNINVTMKQFHEKLAVGVEDKRTIMDFQKRQDSAIDRVENEIQDLQSQCLKLKEQRDSLEKSLKVSDSKIGELDSEKNSLHAELQEAKKDADTCREQWQQSTMESAELRDSLAKLNSELLRVKESDRALHEQLESERAVAEQLSVEHSRSISALQHKCDELKTEAERSTKEHASTKNELEACHGELTHTQSLLSLTRSALEEAGRDIESLKATATDMQKREAELERTNDIQTKKAAEFAEITAQLHQELSGLSSTVVELRERNGALEAAEALKTSELEKTTENLHEAEETIKSLEESSKSCAELSSRVKKERKRSDRLSQSLESALKQVDDLTVAKADLEKSAAELDIARKQLEEELLSTKTKLNDTLESNSKLLQRHKHDVEVMKSAYDKKRDELDSCEAKLQLATAKGSASSDPALQAELEETKQQLRAARQKVKQLQDSMVTELAKFSEASTSSRQEHPEGIDTCSSDPDAAPSRNSRHKRITGRRKKISNTQSGVKTPKVVEQDVAVESIVKIPAAVPMKRRKPSSNKPRKSRKFNASEVRTPTSSSTLPGGLASSKRTSRVRQLVMRDKLAAQSKFSYAIAQWEEAAAKVHV